MAILDYKSDKVSWTLTTEMGSEIDYNSLVLKNFQLAIDTFNDFVALDTVKVDRVGTSDIYRYEFKTKDGREWNQEISIDGVVTMNFDVPDFWNEALEFVYHNDVRRFLIELVREMRLIKASYKWA